MCEAADVSRAGFYRRQEPTTQDRDIDLRDEIQKIALEFPCYGRRRITAELKRRGWEVNHKRVHRIMREDNLLCLRRRKFVVTTNSNHPHPVLSEPRGGPGHHRRQPTVGSRYHLYPAGDRVRLFGGHSGAFSRRVVGWALDRTLEAALVMTALRRAFEERRPAPGLVHHSDRGVQYACGDYTELLKQHNSTISMSRKGNPYPNFRSWDEFPVKNEPGGEVKPLSSIEHFR
jgi:transposase InsO family protein